MSKTPARRVDIHALNLHVTENVNNVYVPNFIFRLDRALVSFSKNTALGSNRDRMSSAN